MKVLKRFHESLLCEIQGRFALKDKAIEELDERSFELCNDLLEIVL